ncbi:MAG: hypothetical protein A2V67_15530 [Deltaproteobacteria bacterium RBG_13_61_14]|nr:MAG: hypothetical protein A2V67_15530 [Deltaproteobacteria bacterium RBG_13_61_14]
MNIVEIYKKFPSHNDCLDHIESVRWAGKPICPYCGSPRCTPMPQEKRYHCNSCFTSFSVTVRTIFHNSKLELQKWFLATTLILNAKKGMSARQLARELKVNKNTAWFMGMRIRKAMLEREERNLLQGIVEMDETFIGGKPRKGDGGNEKHKRGRGTKKTSVIEMIERGGKVRAKVAKRVNGKTISSPVRRNVDTQNATLVTDEYKGYLGISRLVPHKTVNHQVWYVDGDVHTNSIESFWALLKRGIVGQYHKVSLRHLPKYIDEFCYRHNHRKHDDLFGLTISRAVGV